jgi:hypothetical protein
LCDCRGADEQRDPDCKSGEVVCTALSSMLAPRELDASVDHLPESDDDAEQHDADHRRVSENAVTEEQDGPVQEIEHV